MLNYTLQYNVDLVQRRFTGEYDTDEWGLDWELVDLVLPLFSFLYKTYWRVETTGLENIPIEGRALLVANHSGQLPWDGMMVGTAILTNTRPGGWCAASMPAILPRIPYVSTLLVRLGQTLATVENGTRLLEQEELVAVFPEGYKGTGKLFKDRYRLARFGRGGFVQMALNTQAPIIPVSVVGSEETYITLAKVPTFSEITGIPYLPITLRFPWLGLLGIVPLPTKWYIDFGEPIYVDNCGPDAADNVRIGLATDRPGAQHGAGDDPQPPGAETFHLFRVGLSTMVTMARFLGRFALILAFSLCLLACEGVASVEPSHGTSPRARQENEPPVPTPPACWTSCFRPGPRRRRQRPGVVASGAEESTAETGLAYTYVLGLSTSDWINLGISLLFVVLGYLVGTLLIRRILPPIARRTPTDLDDRLLEKLGPDLRWLLVVFALQFATDRLTFVGAGVKDLMADVYFFVGLAIVMQAGWRLIDLAGRWYGERSRGAGREEELAPIITLLARIFRIVLLVTGLVILLAHFGTNITALAVALGLGGSGPYPGGAGHHRRRHRRVHHPR